MAEAKANVMHMADTVYVFPKPSVLMPEYSGGGCLIDFYGEVFDLDFAYPMFRRHKDGNYYHCGELMENWGTLTFTDGPRFGRFVGQVFGSDYCGRYISRPYYLLHTLKDQVRRFVFAHAVSCGDDGFCIDDVVGMMYYAEKAGIPLDKCFVRRYVPGQGMVGPEVFLESAWEQVRDQVKPEPDGGRREITRLMTLSGMHKKQFAEYFGIKPRTVENWVYLPGSDAPDWTVPLMELKLEVDGKI